MDEPISVHHVITFDPDGETQVRMMPGGLVVAFAFMPPSWAEDDPDRFADFDRQVVAATGVAVTWEDRGVFRIPNPAPDTVDRLRAFLSSYPR